MGVLGLVAWATNKTPWRWLTLPLVGLFVAALVWHALRDQKRFAALVAEPALRGKVAACPRCEYDLRGNPNALSCPECGLSVPPRVRAEGA